MRAVWAIVLAVAALPATAETRRILTFDDLRGWSTDQHDHALSVFRNTCMDLKGDDWSALCNLAKDTPDARQFFELFFRPVLIEDGNPPLITGYFEPELMGSRNRTTRFRHPVYRLPPEGAPTLTRSEIETGVPLSEQGLEIAWVEDAVGLFYMQVQGSGRIRLTDGSVIRLGYAGENGHPYRSPGAELVRRGIYEAHQVSARVIRNWVRRNPDEGRALLNASPSYVFFRVINGLNSDTGPRGAMNRSITAERSIAIDPSFVPLGAPVWLEKGGQQPLFRLVVAQDTGGAIKGAQRADIFMGSGEKAGLAAAQLKDKGRLVVLLPIQQALSTAKEY